MATSVKSLGEPTPSGIRMLLHKLLFRGTVGQGLFENTTTLLTFADRTGATPSCTTTPQHVLADL
eukprot:2979706-Pyramimonas_sp.AAC.1